MKLWESGEITRAEIMLREARDIHSKIGNVGALAEDLRHVAESSLQRGNVKDAMESYQQALQHPEKWSGSGEKLLRFKALATRWYAKEILAGLGNFTRSLWNYAVRAWIFKTH